LAVDRRFDRPLGGFGLVRHNAIVVLPFAGLVLWLAVRRASRWAAVALAVAPLLAFVAGEAAVDRLFNVEKVHLERHMMAFDLVGLCALDAKACDSLPYIHSYLRAPDYARRYVPGNMALSMWTDPPILDYAAMWNGDLLRAEYLRAARQFPGLLLRVKLAAFVPLLGLHEAHLYLYGPEIHANDYGLTLNTRYAPVRDRLAGLTRAAVENPLLRLVSGVQLVWILMAGVWIVALLATPRKRTLAAVALLPLAFALSYLLATPAADYRLLYPATLAFKVITFAWLGGWLAVRWL